MRIALIVGIVLLVMSAVLYFATESSRVAIGLLIVGVLAVVVGLVGNRGSGPTV